MQCCWYIAAVAAVICAYMIGWTRAANECRPMIEAAYVRGLDGRSYGERMIKQNDIFVTSCGTRRIK